MRREHVSYGGGGSILPSGYIQLEFLEGTGTQFIDTGVSNLGSSQRVVMDFSWVEAGSFQVNGFGNSQNGITVRFGCDSQNNFTYAAQTSGTWVYNNCGPVDTSRHVFDIQSGSQKFDGVQLSSNTISTWNRNFYLFATNDQWVNNTYHVQYYCKCRIYNCKFYSDGVLVRDMVPALRASDFKPGLYDIVNDVFYTNLGTGEFVYKYNTDSYVKWLKSIGCIFYCAFDGVTGTMDLINNVPLTLSGNGSISYDSSLDMYSITTSSSQGQDIGYWDNGIGIGTFPDDDYSALYTAQKITTTSGKSMHGVTPYSDNFRTCQALDMLYNGSGDVSGWPATVTNVAASFSTTNGWRRYYQDGTLFGEYTIFAQFQPSNWVTSGNHLCLGRTPVDSNSSHRGVSLYIGKTYIFNTALDLATIRKIQGYE